MLRLLPNHREQCRDVVHHDLHARADRSESSQAQQVESCGSQRGRVELPVFVLPQHTPPTTRRVRRLLIGGSPDQGRCSA